MLSSRFYNIFCYDSYNIVTNQNTIIDRNYLKNNLNIFKIRRYYLREKQNETTDWEIFKMKIFFLKKPDV